MKYMLQQNTFYSARLALISAFLLTMTPVYVSADSRFGSGHRFYAFNKLHRIDASLTPTRMMSDEQLYRAAETHRNQIMPYEHQRANHFWLRSEQGDCYEGGAALRKVLTATLSNMYPNIAYRGEKFNDDEDQDNYQESSYVIRNLENYSLRLSQSRVSLKFTYDF